MPAVTLITDWNNYDYYLAAFKGKLLSLDVQAPFVEISHQISVHNIPQVSFLIQQSYPFFPKESVHIIAVGSQPEPGYNYILAHAYGHYFLCADNTILSLVFPEYNEAKYIEIIPEKKTLLPEIDIFLPIASKLLKGAKPEEFGKPIAKINHLNGFRTMIEPNQIDGHVLYIDSYGNAISNITREEFEKIGKGRKFEIHVTSFHYKIHKISENYYANKGEFVALFNYLNLLEVAQAEGSIATLLSIKVGSRILVRFTDKPTEIILK